MKNYRVETVGDYVDYRLRKLDPEDKEYMVRFQTPLTIKHRGEFIRDFDLQAITSSLKRRLYILSCFEGIETKVMQWNPPEDAVIETVERYMTKVPRYSNRKNEKMYLEGIEGLCRVSGIDRETLRYLLAGEVLHIGKNNSFGFGRYHISGVDSTQAGAL